MNALVRFRNFVWGEPPESKAEKKLLFKIDCFVMSFVCLNYWINYVDRSNVANAYVSGMRDDLNMVGNQYNVVNTCFTVGYIVFMIPNNIMLLKVQPRYWLSFCALAWGVLTLSIYKVTSYKQLCVIRFFQAMFESSTFSGTHLILGSWYKEDELAKRSAIFTSSGLAGSIISSVMQAAIYNNMDDYNGIRGWRWLFIIDFIITVPIIIYGFFFFPDTPETSKAFYFSEEEKKLAMERVPPRPHTSLDFSVVKRVVGNWHWWMFSLLWALGGENESFATNSLLSLWLLYHDYTVENRNYYPMGIYGIGVVATISCAIYADKTRKHWHVAVFISAILIICSIMMLANPLNTGVVFAAQYLSGFAYAGQATFFAWANVVCYDDLEERAVILASMNMFSGALNAWWSLLFYAADTVPRFRKGCYAMIATTIATALVAGALRYYQVKEEKQKALATGNILVIDEESAGESNSLSKENHEVDSKSADAI